MLLSPWFTGYGFCTFHYSSCWIHCVEVSTDPQRSPYYSWQCTSCSSLFYGKKGIKILLPYPVPLQSNWKALAQSEMKVGHGKNCYLSMQWIWYSHRWKRMHSLWWPPGIMAILTVIYWYSVSKWLYLYSRAITPNQTRQLDCEGNGDVPECTAENTTVCNQQLYSPESQGIFTGNCAANGRCEMYSWCPLENDSNPDIVNGVGAFTAFVKVDIKFCVHIYRIQCFVHDLFSVMDIMDLVSKPLESLETITMTSEYVNEYPLSFS